MRRIYLALAFWLATGAGAAAQTEYGLGEARLSPEGREYSDVLDAARAPPMAELGRDALRFSSQPALGGVGYVITLKANGRATVGWFYGHPGLGWRRTRQTTFEVSESEYRDVAGRVDELLAAGLAEIQQYEGDDDPAIRVCTDGPGYRTERIRDGAASWYRPFCDEAQDEIASYLMGWAFRHLGE